jgi:hypothetical protein
MPRKPTRYANHPITKYVRSLDGEFYLGREVAELLDCSITTLANIRRSSKSPMGPTHNAQYGSVVLHLYTRARVDKIAEYMREISGEERGLKRRGPIVLWTRSETHTRRREFGRARTYRNRAAVYREQGQTEKAEELEQRSAAVLSKLEKVRLQRRRAARRVKRK